MDFGLFLDTRIRHGDETAWEVNSELGERLRGLFHINRLRVFKARGCHVDFKVWRSL